MYVGCRSQFVLCFFFSSRRLHTRCYRDWSSDVCSSDLPEEVGRKDTDEEYAHHGEYYAQARYVERHIRVRVGNPRQQVQDAVHEPDDDGEDLDGEVQGHHDKEPCYEIASEYLCHRRCAASSALTFFI